MAGIKIISPDDASLMTYYPSEYAHHIYWAPRQSKPNTHRLTIYMKPQNGGPTAVYHRRGGGHMDWKVARTHERDAVHDLLERTLLMLL